MATNALSPSAIQVSMDRTQAERLDQYTLWQILGIWALVALPMALLVWVVVPAIIPYSPLPPGITYWLAIIVGMAWEFVVALVIIYRELGTLRWSAIRQRTWLQTPRDPKTDQPNRKLYWWVLPPLLLDALGDCRSWRLSGCAYSLVVSWCAGPAVHRYGSIGSPRVRGPMVDHWELSWSVLSSTISWARNFSGMAFSCPRCMGFLESTIGWQMPFCSVFTT